LRPNAELSGGEAVRLERIVSCCLLELSTVDRHPLDIDKLYTVQTANIDGSHLDSVWHVSEAEGLAPTGRAKLVLDHMLVEGVRTELVRACRNRE
jgi:hypothetical protein